MNIGYNIDLICDADLSTYERYAKNMRSHFTLEQCTDFHRIQGAAMIAHSPNLGIHILNSLNPVLYQQEFDFEERMSSFFDSLQELKALPTVPKKTDKEQRDDLRNFLSKKGRGRK